MASRSNENKMSDGGRERASLALKGWKSSQKWSVQRSAVRSIAWLGVGVASGLAWNENSEDERRGVTNGDRIKNLPGTQATVSGAEQRELEPARRTNSRGLQPDSRRGREPSG